MKSIGHKRKFTSANTILAETLRGDLDQACYMSSRKRVCDTINYARSKDRPRHPNNLDFELDMRAIPENFIVKDVKTDDGQRHVILMTEYQKELLKHAPRWFMDGTLKLVKKPMIQLFSI